MTEISRKAGVITAIETQQKDKERVNIYVDGSFALGLTALQAVARGLRPGKELTAADIEAMQTVDQVDKAFAAAVNFLSYRPRSKREVEDYFRRKKIEAAAAQTAIEKLERLALLNDTEFARFWIENRQTFRPRGARALRMEMRQKGIDADIIDSALESIGDEEETAYATGLKKARSYAGLDETEFCRKMVGFLQRRGFPYDAAMRASRRIFVDIITPGPAG